MVDKKEWEMLQEKWLTVGEVYQEPKRGAYKLKHFIQHCIPLLKGRKVVEIGCNAGLFGVHIIKVAESYTGVEPGNRIREKKSAPKTDYFKQAQITVQYVNKPSFNIYNDLIEEYCKRDEDINTFFACFALYHFRDNEIELLKKHVWSKCDLIIILNREQYRPTKHNSYKFWKSKNVKKFFEGLGYKVEIIWGESKRGKIFSEVICKKEKA